jgi:hypothetical protein
MMKRILWVALPVSLLAIPLGLLVVLGFPGTPGTGTAPLNTVASPRSPDKNTSQKASPSEQKRTSRKLGMPRTAFEYARLCEPELGVPPRVNLDECVEIPLYVNGVQTYGNLGRSCDNPTFLGKDTISGSTLQRYEGQTADGDPLPDVIWVVFGRNNSSSPGQVVGSVQMIGYNKKTGATAFFENHRVTPWVTVDEDTLRMRGTMPWIDKPEEFNKAFVTAGNVQCVQCHQNDPFITNSFINAAKIPGTDESVVPALGKDSPYYVIGGENWDMRTMHLKGNKCFTCHRVGMGTLSLFMENGWDPNEHMPPHDPGSLAKDLRELLDAWQKGPEHVEDAAWIIPPARGKDRQVVGDDYAYKATFNRTGTNDKKAFQKTVTLKDHDKEVEQLLKQLRDPNVRKAFANWIANNGLTEDTLEKLRSMAAGDDTDDGKSYNKDNYEKRDDKDKKQ